MAIFRCKMCGGELDVAENATVAECEYCGSKQTVPTARDEELASLFNRANSLRRKCEFDKAEQLYEKILVKDDKQSEAYWGVLLCRYGIEYVEDPATSQRIPTCHRTAFEAITSDEYYKSALQCADPVQRKIYEQEAKYIDDVQKDILALSQQEEPYDVFICYKETDSGRRTQDSVIANDIYYQLTNEGFKVFYAAITLENKLGSAYEPVIFAALNSAKVMLAIGTKPEYFNAVWVKNEWSRFLKMMKTDKSKQLIPCYRDMDAYELPEEFAHLQAQDMSKIGFVSDIVRGIKKIARKEEAKPAPTEVGGTNLKNLLKRAYLDLESGNFESARAQFDKMQDIAPENGEVYLIGLLCDLQLSRPEDLEECLTPFTNNNNLRNFIRFADPTLKARVDKLLQLNENWRQYCAVKQSFDLLSDDTIYENTKNQLVALGDYRDSKDLIESLPDLRDKALANDIQEIIEQIKKYGDYSDSYATLYQAEYDMLLSEKKVYESDLNLHGTSNWWNAKKEARLSELQKLIEEENKHKEAHDNYNIIERCTYCKQLLAKIRNGSVRSQCAKLLKNSVKNYKHTIYNKTETQKKLDENSAREFEEVKKQYFACTTANNKMTKVGPLTLAGLVLLGITIILFIVFLVRIMNDDDYSIGLPIAGALMAQITLATFVICIAKRSAIFKSINVKNSLEFKDKCSEVSNKYLTLKQSANAKNNDNVELVQKHIDECNKLLSELEQEYPDE